ncbi:MAG: diacylglycerol kinase family lipid kinase [Paramuribaculum sp.]|nr:diacylglycerol kinase family lipid kinase [Paramuribaculum sp.]
MDRQRALLIINPISGTAGKKGLDRMVSASLDMDLEVAWTGGRGDATRLACEAVDRGYHTVIAAGGDGTVNETARALCGSDTSLGIIPCGSGNGLARHLGIPVDIEGSIEIIKRNHIERCDYGLADSTPFFCTFGVGFDAAVSHKFAAARRRGRLTYVRDTFLEYLSYSPESYRISAPEVGLLTEKAFLVAVCNASQYGNNAYIAPNASMTDGLLDVTIVHSGNPLTTALVGLDLLTGFIDRNTQIHSFRTPALTITRSASGPVHLDGEPASMGPRIQLACCASALSIYTPGTSETFKPIITPMRAFMRDIHYAIRHIFK